jgi:hypothetical protein
MMRGAILALLWAFAACSGGDVLNPIDVDKPPPEPAPEPRQPGPEPQPDPDLPPNPDAPPDPPDPNEGLCTFPENPPQDVPCEDDADYCDPIESQFSPEADILAAWSHVDGDEFVMQVRFLAPPFHHIWGLMLRFLVDEPTATTVTGIGRYYEDIESGLAGEICYVLNQYRYVPTSRGYPPPDRFVEFRSTDPSPPFDPCWFRLGLASGLVEFRLPVGPSGARLYAVGAYGLDDVPASNDVTWSGDPAFLVSRGGHADDQDTLVSICDLTCPFE